LIRVHSYETLGTHEGPGIRLVIFMQGCNAKCIYCHNPDTWPECAGKSVENDVILEKIKNSIPYFGDHGGVTFSGGDPLVQVDDLIPLCRNIKEMGVNIAIETNASIFNEKVKQLMDLTDLLLLDLKHIDAEWRKKITGLSFDPLKFAEYREKNKQPFWLRYVLVPGYTDEKDCLRDIAEIFSRFKWLKKTEILPYHEGGENKYEKLDIDYQGSHIDTPDQELIEEAKEILAAKLSDVVVR